MADEFAPTFVPDDDDQGYMDDVDPDAYAAMDAPDEEAEDEARMQAAGQGGPRRLDFAAYGNLSGAFSNPLDPASGAGTAPISSQLNLRMTGSQLPNMSQHRPSAAAPAAAAASSATGGLSAFQLERAAEERRQRANGNAGGPQPSASAMFPSPSVLPPLLRSVSELRQRVLDDDRLYVYRRAPVVGEFMPVTTAAGDRVFLTMSTAEEAARKLQAHSNLHRTQQMHRDLGQINVRAMIRELDDEATAAAMRASFAEVKAREWDSASDDDEKTKLRKRRQRKERLKAKLDLRDQTLAIAARNQKLWVDKYQPKGYADLLSPETINREVLEWLKGWDLCVFGAKKSAAGDHSGSVDPGLRTLDNLMLSAGMLSATTRRPKKPLNVIAADGETDIRPEHKVILLCGPPGLGKTTLAHILARQAGYNAYEINASDDRNPAVLEAKIRAATEMQAVSFGGKHEARPNCLILDEIDGVAGETAGQAGAISMLVKLITAEPRQSKKHGKKATATAEDDQPADDSESDADDENPGAEDQPRKPKKSSARDGGGDGAVSSTLSGAGKKITKPGPLKRPIICICNDQFAAALRPLRAIAKIFEFGPAPKGRFVERLKQITKSEGMDVDARTLGALADVVDCDIRSALNTLQFVHTRATPGIIGPKLTSAMLNSLALGRKDVEKSRFEIWDAIFCESRTSKRDSSLTMRNSRENEATNPNGVSQVVNAKAQKLAELSGLLSDAGDLDKIFEGVFHNYLRIGMPDPSGSKTVECAEWFVFADLVERKVSQDLEHGLMAYVPYAAMGLHYLTARPRKSKLESPGWMYHQWVESQRNQQIVQAFLAPSNIFAIRGTTIQSTVLDVLPHVLDIIHPTIRAVNFQLLTSREKSELANLIDTMLSLAITYRPEIITSFGGSSSASSSSGWKPPNALEQNVVYKLEPQIDLVSEWSNPLDANSTKKWEPKDKFGNAFQQKPKFGQPQIQATATPSFKLDKRDINMPSKVKREVLRELEFESMRRAEAARSARFDEEQKEEASGATKEAASAAAAASSPPENLFSPAVQRILDEEKRKRDRASLDAAAAVAAAKTPPVPASKLPAGTSADDDISPATKRARNSAALNFLNQHADAAKNSRARQRGRATPAALAGMKTEKEQQAAHSMQDDANATSMPPPPLPAHALHPLHYKYNEGCTNAVRRTVAVSHFLPL